MDEPAASSTTDRRTLADAVRQELVRQSQMPLSAGLYLVATPIGNLGDITLRALTILDRADVIYCEDTRHSRTLLSHFAISRPMRPYHEHNAEAERPKILAALEAGKIVALISDAGTPLVSDPGYKLAREVIERGVPVIAAPGASAVMTGLVMSGLPSDTVVFAGFLPTKEIARRERLLQLCALPATLIVFESPARLAKCLRGMAEITATREVVVARELTKKFEEIRRGTAAALADWAEGTDVRGEIVILVAPPPSKSDASDDDIVQALRSALADQRLKDAARAVADQLRVSRSRVYDLGLKLKAEEPEEEAE